MEWDQDVKIKYDQIMDKVPVFMRALAQDKVSKQLAMILQKEQRTLITEKDMVNAFFMATPFGFHGPLKSDMEELGINYEQYGHQR